MTYEDQRHMMHMKAYLVERLGWRRRDEIEEWDLETTFEQFRREYHGENKVMTKTKANKNIWVR
ncbi:TPA: hypothetical protein ACSVZR_003918 [Bacillus cereus]